MSTGTRKFIEKSIINKWRRENPNWSSIVFEFWEARGGVREDKFQYLFSKQNAGKKLEQKVCLLFSFTVYFTLE